MVEGFHGIIAFWLVLDSLGAGIFFPDISSEAAVFCFVVDFFGGAEGGAKGEAGGFGRGGTILFFSSSRSGNRLVALVIDSSYSFTRFIALPSSDTLRQTSCSGSYPFQRTRYSTSRAVSRLLRIPSSSKDLTSGVSSSTYTESGWFGLGRRKGSADDGGDDFS